MVARTLLHFQLVNTKACIWLVGTKCKVLFLLSRDLRLKIFKTLLFDRSSVVSVASHRDMEKEAGVSSPNITISSLGGKRDEREAIGEEHNMDRDSSVSASKKIATL
ncbi:hypothetical protein QYF36_021265 [Acer negundo]|nr:hypothetical protein QYF36_021265 [Acer negundo]